MSVYLSQLILNPRSRCARVDLADCHELHRTLMRAFPQAAGTDEQHGARERFGILHRVETDAHSGAARVLVQSLVQPDWSPIEQQSDPTPYLLPEDLLSGCRNPDWKDIGAKLDALRAGDALVFRLRANPTRRVSDRSPATSEDKLQGKRVELQTDEEWQAWLARKGDQSGFRVLAARGAADAPGQRHAMRDTFGFEPGRKPDEPVPDARTTVGLKLTGIKGPRSGGRKLTFGSVLFDGRLEVTDVDAFRLALERGIGSGKAYGFGLLSVAPDRAAS